MSAFRPNHPSNRQDCLFHFWTRQVDGKFKSCMTLVKTLEALNIKKIMLFPVLQAIGNSKCKNIEFQSKESKFHSKCPHKENFDVLF